MQVQLHRGPGYAAGPYSESRRQERYAAAVCQRCLELFDDMYPASQATEVITKVVRKVVSKVVRRLIRKVVSTCTNFLTSLLTTLLMTLDRGSPWFDSKELATPPPADEVEIAGEAAPDPSLPTTGSRGRGQPRSLVQLAGGGVASWEEGQKGDRWIS